MHLHVPCESWSLLYLSLSYSNLASVVCVCVVGSRLIQARFCVYTENCSLIGFVRAEQVMFGAHMLCFYYYQTIPNFLCRSSRSTLFEPCLFMIVNHEFLQNLSIRFSHRSVQFTNGYCVCWKEESGVLKIILWIRECLNLSTIQSKLDEFHISKKNKISSINDFIGRIKPSSIPTSLKTGEHEVLSRDLYDFIGSIIPTSHLKKSDLILNGLYQMMNRLGMSDS